MKRFHYACSVVLQECYKKALLIENELYAFLLRIEIIKSMQIRK